MKNQYVGDIGDFGKYALLRSILKSRLKLGVNWYLTTDDTDGGSLTSYLYTDNYSGYDDKLFEILKDIVDSNSRNIASVQNSMIFPKCTVFYDAKLNMTGEPDYQERRKIRSDWHSKALDRLHACDIVFLDPDNGIKVKSVSLTSKKGNKYIGLDELKAYYKRGQSVIFYNHSGREKDYIDRFKLLKNDPDFKCADWLGLKFKKGPTRYYVLALRSEHFPKVKALLEEFLKSAWRDCFSPMNL